MIDINLIRENPEEIKQKLAKKLYEVDFTDFLEKDKLRKSLRYENDSLKSERNKTSALVPQLKKEGKDATEIIENMKKLGDKIKENDDKIDEIEKELQYFLDCLPNLPADDLLPGGKENNKEIASWGEKPNFNFEPKNHVDLAESLGYAREVKEYKKNPENFKGHVGDISTVIRVAITSRRNTPDLYAILKILTKDRIQDRVNKLKI